MSISDDLYRQYLDQSVIPSTDNFLIMRHKPHVFSKRPYHHHASIEVNFLINCEMDYSFSGSHVTVHPGYMICFWGAAPHGVVDVRGDGDMVNLYISFAQILQWGLPTRITDALISGDVICNKAPCPIDAVRFGHWATEFKRDDINWRKLVLSEISSRFTRLALDGWNTLHHDYRQSSTVVGRGKSMLHVEEMLRFISENHTSDISVSDVAEFVGLSPSHAMTLFKRIVGLPIKEHLTRVRLSHARMLLAESEMKILSIAMDSGFRSLSSFYEAFQNHFSTSPAAFRKQARNIGKI
ncbi:helix-turn-helix domain-containing protein [Pseudovibrio sp. FO-BEG1]|uniref:helix-turn-helix domain-containing protein n=1 Tax=Pseudovibrio sp. (strain FO-BEG1) TaxID=911045 RepID=UPI001AD9176B|nr:helix-turn-helix domain-containing protein [Pseudovibrio sp. FO-BEG1]